MKRDITELSKDDLIILAKNYSATMSRVSKLYNKSKADYNYLKRRNEIVEDRLKYLKDIWEKKMGCNTNFVGADRNIRKGKKRENKKNSYISYSENNGGNKMKVEDKFVSVKVPKDLHKHLKAKAKESGMALGNYLFDCICRVHNIKYIPASVEIPEEETKTIKMLR